MNFAYLREERREHWRFILTGLIPPGLLWLRRWLRYRRWYPTSSITPSSQVDPRASLGAYTIIHGATLGATVSLGECTTIGAGSSLSGLGPITIGKFCSIGPDCFLRSDNHALDATTTYPLEQMLHGAAAEGESFQGQEIRIGHDVWLGRGVTVLAGADIGTGCLVAAGCVVPGKPFPPYSVIGGVPGKVLRPRFPGPTVDRLLAGAWWDRPLAEIFGPLRGALLQPPEG